MKKQPRSKAYSPDDWATSKRYLLDGIDPKLWNRVRIRARREDVSIRALILQLLTEHVSKPTTKGKGTEQ